MKKVKVFKASIQLLFFFLYSFHGGKLWNKKGKPSRKESTEIMYSKNLQEQNVSCKKKITASVLISK